MKSYKAIYEPNCITKYLNSLDFFYLLFFLDFKLLITIFILILINILILFEELKIFSIKKYNINF